MSASFQPRFEQLETRLVPAVIYDAATQFVTLQGTPVADHFECFHGLSSAGVPLLIVTEGVAPTAVRHEFDLTKRPVTRVQANLGNGDDIVACNTAMSIPLFANCGLGRDVITGTAVADRIFGGGGWDTVWAGDGDDFIDGQADGDYLHGQNGNDTIYGDIGNDFIWGEQGVDTIHGGNDSDDQIWGGTEDDFLFGDGGNDTIQGEEGVDTINGNDGNDYLYGGPGDDFIRGSTGRDFLYGGDGSDNLQGENGNDRIEGDPANSLAPGNDIISGGANDDTILGYAGNDDINGNDGVDTIFGGDGNDVLRGGTGNDTIHGDNGNDRLFGDNDRDQLFGDAGDDWLNGGQGNDTLDGGPQDDILVSVDNATTDTLFGRLGFDSFWIDQNWGAADDVRDETGNEFDTNFHQVTTFANGADRTLNGDAIADPSTQANGSIFPYANFRNNSLFAEGGPVITDIRQGLLGDCWMLSSLGAALTVTPNVIRQTVVDFGDGTYGVQLDNRIYRVDADLPLVNGMLPDRTLAFADISTNGSIWVPIIEKAWATHRSNAYSSIEGSTAYFGMGTIGGQDRHIYMVSDGSLVLGNLQNNVGWKGVLNTKNSINNVSILLNDHGYVITDVNIANDTVTVYNPHGIDNIPLRNADGTPQLDGHGNPIAGPAQGDDDGFITLTVAQFCSDAADPFGAITADFSRFF